jgi:hypothetical protein
MALGAGIGNDHIRFTKTDIGIKKVGSTLPFTNTADTNHFEKTKLATTYLEIPVEFRFSADPLNVKGLKAAIGIKAGTLIDAHTRNSKYQNRSGNSLGDFTVKESGRRYFNRTRIVATARVGYGRLSLFGSYQLTNVFKDGQGPAVRTWALGIALSGL